MTMHGDIVFIDAGVGDVAGLLAGMRPGVEVYLVRNGLAEIAQILQNRQNIDSVQIVSHGQTNAITLNGQVLHAESLVAYVSELRTIGSALAPHGDILLYGCDIGAVDGQHADFVAALAAATGRDVAASTDATGSALLGGDWVLERQTGAIEAGLFADGAAVDFAELLAAPVTETFDGVPLSAGHSYGTPGQARIINDWTFSLLNASGNLDTSINSFVDVTNLTSETSLANDGADHAALLNGNFTAGTGQAAAVLAATDGSEFAFQSIVVEQGFSAGADYRVVGYRNGGAVSGATQDFTAGAYPNGGTLVTVSGSAWQNLDEVRIVRQGGETDISIYVDDITVAAVVRPTATVVVADTALAVGETSLVTFTFSQAVTGFTNADLTVANGGLSAVSSSDGGITWTATFTPTANVTDTTNVIALNMTGVALATTAATGTGTQNSNNYAIDTARPTATIAVADNALGIGETSLVTITFSEAVTGFTNADLTVANGNLGAVSSSDGGTTWTATLTPTASITDPTNVITLANTGVTDAAGNAGTGTTDSNNYAIDSIRPTAGIVVADTSLLAGETSLVTITFSEAVAGFTNADLTVANGNLSAVSSSDGGITWTATFTPTANITAGANVITLANTGVTDAAGNAGTGTTDSNNYSVNTVRPTASIVVADSSLAVGETSLVTITFSEAVTGFTNADLTIANGNLSAVSSSDGGITWTATLTPTASITDPTNIITLANTGVTNSAGNAGAGTTDSNNYAIDTARPTAAVVVADTSLTIGETSLVTITFSEAVTGFTNADLTIANGNLSAVSSSDGGITWTATFTPTANVTAGTNVITLANTGVTDAAGNAGTGTTDSNNYAIDTARPTATIVVADNSLTIGETSLVTFTFSEAVTGFTNADLTVANGNLSAVSSSDGGITWTATFTPTANITAGTNVITLANTGVTDAAGNAGAGTTDSNNYAIDTARPTATILVADSALSIGETSAVTFTFSEAVTGFTNADLTIANGNLGAVSSSDGGVTWTATFTPTANITAGANVITLANTGVQDAAGNAGTGTTNSNSYAVDTARPTATLAVADNSLTIGETSLVTITFSEAVTGFTNADLSIANGNLSAVSSSDGGITWTATFTPTASITAGTNVITLANTGVQDLAGNAGTGTTDSNNYSVDTVRPTATLVVADTSLLAGETSLVTITFSEAVTGFTNADLTVANGNLSAVSSSDGGITWTATFTPSANITAGTNVITLANTGVTDAAGNAGAGTTNSNNYAIDTARPTATIVVADSSLTIGESSLVTFTFSEAVTGFTNADLTIANGNLGAVSSSDGGITWTATFTPTANITAGANVITLANTGVQDAAGNTGTGTTNSNSYAVDTARPTATVSVADSVIGIGEAPLVTFTFSEAVTGFTNADLTIANGTLSAVSSGDGGITWTATFTPAGGVTAASNLITLANTGVQDLAGNAGTGTTNSSTYAVDTQAPVFSGATVNGNQLVLSYTEAMTLDPANTPSNGAFAVVSGGVTNAVTGVAVSAGAKTVTLTLSSAVAAGEAVTVAYTDPTAGNDANAIQDAAGNDAASLGATAATNLTPVIPDPPAPAPSAQPDNDGIPAAVEDQTPGIPGPGGTRLAGDGNGDGIKDSAQGNVASTGFVDPGSAQPSFITLVAGSQDGKVGSGSGGASITALVQQGAPTGLPDGLKAPLGLVSFSSQLGQGHTAENFSLYVDPALGLNGYWTQDRTTGTWVNLASEPYGGKMVMEGGRLRLDFQIADGGRFDADGRVNGAVTDLGAPGHMPLSIVGLPPDMPHDGFWF